ncbi:MAG TPA: hypothetical protein DCZ37_06510 [Alteromonas macleodii]|nr:hypothetical protein [Alteromonas macleodii]|tara:strand:+ start:779 stop:1186 length:408 start_codon:yes stop_codon:yes gene_type:complete
MSEAEALEINEETKETIGDVINAKAKIKEQLDALSVQEKELKEQNEELDRKLFSMMDKDGVSRTANDSFSASINTDTVPNVTDWDAFYQHCLDTQQLTLFQKRVTSLACKELWAAGESIPGIEQREIRRINFRKL